MKVKLPLGETRGLANKMRSITSGLCSLHLELLDYEKLIKAEQDRLIAEKSSQGQGTTGWLRKS